MTEETMIANEEAGTPEANIEAPPQELEQPASTEDGANKESSEKDIFEGLEFSDKQAEYVKHIQEEAEKRNQMIEEKELMLQRQATEIGNIRKLEQELVHINDEMATIKKKKENLAEQFYDNPGQYDNEIQKLAQLENQRQTQLKQYAKAQIKQAVPNYEDLKKGEIVEVLKQEGALDHEIPGFLNELDSNPIVAIQIAKRALDIRRMKSLEERLEKANQSSKTISEKIAKANPLNPISSSNSISNIEQSQEFKTPAYGLFSSA